MKSLLKKFRIGAVGVLMLVTAILLAAAWESAVATPTAVGSQSKRSLVVIKELGSSQMTPDKSFLGRFSLVVDGVIEDSGKTAIYPSLGPLRSVDGQQQQIVFGTDNLTSKSGTLTISLRGVNIAVNNINPAKDAMDSEYGTWKITSGTGAYKNWKGSGRWASVGTTSANYIEWDGYVVH